MAVSVGITKAEQRSEEAGERADEAAREKIDEGARARAETEAAKKAEQEAKEKAEREAEKTARVQAKKVARLVAEKEAMKRVERDAKEKEKFERDEDERNRREKEVKEKAEGEAKEREEEKKPLASNKTKTAWGSVARRNDSSQKAPAPSQKNEWANTWDVGPAEKMGPSDLAPIFTSTASGPFDSASNFDFLSTGRKDSPGGALEDAGPRIPATKKGKNRSGSPSNIYSVATPTETADVRKPDALEDQHMNMSARISVSSRSEAERWTDSEQGPSPTEPTPPALLPELGSGLETFTNATPELPGAPKGIKDEAPATPKPWPVPSLTPASQSPVPTPTPLGPPARIEPEKPLSLWDRKKLKVPSPPVPAPASSLFGGGDGANSGIWGDASGGGGNGESIAMPAIRVGDRQSVFTDTARDRTREDQRENVIEGFLGSGAARRRNDSAQSQAPVKPSPKPASAPFPAPQKSGGWGSWGSSLLTNIAHNAANPDRSPSPEPVPVKPKIENPPKGFTPSQPPKSQPAGFGSVNKPAWGAGGPVDNNAWGAPQPGPTPMAQKTPTGPAWSAKPPVSTFGSGATGWGAGTGSSFGSGVGKNLSVDTTTKPLESSLNIAGPENIPESAVEIKHVPVPGRFCSAIVDQETGDVQGHAWGWKEGGGEGLKGALKVPYQTEQMEPEPQPEVAEPAKMEEVVTPADEDEFDWANTAKKSKKKSQVNCIANTPSVPNTPDPENWGGNSGGGAGGGMKKKKKGKK